MRNRRNRGFTLVEAMIGLGMFSMLVVGIFGAKAYVNRSVSDSVVRRDAFRIAEIALNDAIRNDRFILPQRMPAGGLAETNGWFFDDTKSVSSCLDSAGKEIAWGRDNPQDPKTNLHCPFMVSFFKVQELDRALAATDPDAAKLPMSRYRLKLRFRIRAPSAERAASIAQDFDFLDVNRLVTHVIPF